MKDLRFRVLYREFLFRLVDLELLSVQGDISKLLGQLAALLIFLGMFLSLPALSVSSRMPPELLLIVSWRYEHLLIATTMLVVGLFAVLSWDSMFPDRRDVLVLAPLPVRAPTLFLAKVTASATALSLTVISLHLFAGLLLPSALAPPSSSVLDMILSFALYRSFVAYWITMLSAGVFIFCSVLCIQGLAAQLLPRRQFLRVSAFLQMAAFCLFLIVYFLQPSLATPKALTAAENQLPLAWLPSYWFLGLFQELSGSAHPALVPLAHRALIGLASVIFGAGAAYLLSYYRTLRKIVEEPDIMPGSHGMNWLPSFGNSLQTAVVQFSIRTLLRSRQHRVILAFYWGVGFAIAILLGRTPVARQQVNVPLLVSSIVMMCLAVIGTRVVFAMPLQLRANWIFRTTPIHGALECLAASRRSLFVLAVAPVWAASAMLLLSIWPWRPAIEHLVALAMLGTILAELCLHGFQKIPFTCSYLPGKSYVHMAVWAFVGLSFLINEGAAFERRALSDLTSYAWMLAILCITAVCARWRTAALAKSEELVLQFEEEPPPAVQVLGLHRDGVLPIEPAH